MKKKSDWRTRFIRLCAVVLPLIVLCFTACKDEDKEENLPFDPTKPVVITDFSPKSGGIGNNIILYGENFGNDPKKLKVIVGGKEANIISVKNNILYCVVPRMATEGDVEISVYDDNGEEVAFAEAEEKFTGRGTRPDSRSPDRGPAAPGRWPRPVPPGSPVQARRGRGCKTLRRSCRSNKTSH